MEDERCCGTGTCIINAEGYCWCGQRWDGTKMCFPEKSEDPAHGHGATSTSQAPSQPSSQPITQPSSQQ